MASKVKVGQALAILGEAFPRDVTAELVGVWLDALDDVSDEALGTAVRRAVRECRFFPNPAEIRNFIGANNAPPVDSEAILSRIWQLADYHPQYGTNPPSAETVRTLFGDAVAQAYGMAGASRLYSGNETTASIARREFAKELEAAVKEQGVSILPRELPALPSGEFNGPVIFGTRQIRGGGFKRLAP